MENRLIEQILKESEMKIKDYQIEMDEFERDPMVLIRKTFSKDALLLLNTIYHYGEDTLLELQNYWYQRLIPRLREHIAVEGVYLSFDESIFPAPIEFIFEDEIVAALQIYDRLYVRYESERRLQLKEKLDELERQKEMTIESMREKEVAMRNPFVLGGANIIKLADIALRQNKYKTKMKEAVYDFQGELLDIERELTEVRIELENKEGSDLEREYTLDRIENRIRLLPGYTNLSAVDGETINTEELSKDEEEGLIL